MRNEDASQAGLNESNAVNARDDADHLAAKDFGPATGNLITGAGTINGSAGTDLGGSDARIVAIEGSGGSDDSFSAGKLEVAGQYGTLTIDADGNYSYVRNAGTPAGVSDVFTYTLQGQAGASDTARLIINIGDVPMLATDGTRLVPGPDGTVVLPAGVELSDVRVVGRDLVVTLPDGSTMVIVDGAIFVPQLVLDGVEVPASNLAALLIGAEPTPAAGDLSPQQQSSGGNFALPPPPLDPGVPLGDLLPPTELTYTPPTVEEINNATDDEPVAGVAAIQLDDDDIPGRNGNAGGPNDDVGSPNATGSGFLPGSDGDGSLAWALLSSGAPSGFSYNLQPDGSIQVVQVQGGNNVVVLTISVNADTGAYTVTENNPVRHATGDTENNSIFVINYSVTDDDGDVALGSLTINVDDDTPTVTVSAGSDANVLLTTDDAQTIGAASDTAVSLADFSGVFGATVVSAGADGLGAGSSSSYALNITGSVSGLSSHGNAINLFILNGVVVGTTGGQPASLADANIVFTVSVSNTGVVTLTQLQQIDHPIASDPDATDAPFADHIVSMADGLVTLTRSETVVDNDGDSVTGSASVNIGANLRFTDDGPTISGAQINSSVTIDETDGAEPVSAGAPIVATSAAPIIVGGAVNYGADGQGPAPTYGLGLVNGAAIGTSIDSGLVTALGDHPITLTLTSSTLITATYQDGGTQTAFTIQMNANGTITVTQYTALEHEIDGPPGPDHNDALNLINGETNLVNATVTYQDFDGDTASASAAIGGAITFLDDGPTVTISAGSDENILLVTGDDGTEGAGTTTDSSTVNFAGVFEIGSSNGGGDGIASSSLLSYSLATAGGASGLTSNGNAINLYMVGDVVVGAVGGQPADLTDPDIVFTVEVNGSGVVTLTQYQQVDHPIADDPDATDAPFSDQTISMLDDSLISLTATATITDNDGDTATDSESIDIAANLVFQDDGPTIDAELAEGASLHIDESLPGVDNAPEETDAVGLGQVTVALVDLIDVTENPVSADQPTTISGGTLVLGPDGGDGLVESGLLTSNGNNPIYLYNVGGVIYGSTALVAPVGVDGSTVFTVAIVGGNVVMTQYQAIEHPTPGASHDENITGLTEGALLLSVTGTDYDGDTDSDTVDLGSIISFGDDGPSVDVIEAALPTDPRLLAALALTTQDDGTEGPGSTSDSSTANFYDLFSLATDGGSDGEASSSLTFDLNLLGGGDGPIDSGLDSHGVTINLYQIDANTIVGSTSLTAIGVNASNTVFQLSTTNGGVVTLTQYQQVDHPIADDPDATDAPFADHIISLDGGLIELVATGSITDNDGDTDSDTESLDLGGLVQFQDDGPTIDAELAEGASLHIDESLPGVDNAPEETDAVGLGQVTVALVDLIDVTENPVSADQPTTISGGTLVLGPDGGDGLVESGLLTSNGNNPIYLYNVGGVIYGSTALVAPVGVDGSTVFTVAIVGGNVVMTQYQAIEHPTPGASHDENITGLTEGALLLSVTGTDYDGDTDSDTVDLGSIISFGDDGPSVDVIEAALPTDPRLLAALALTTQDDGTEGPGSTSDSSTANFYDLFSLATDGGSDGEASSSLTFDLNLLGGGDGPIDSGLDSHGVTINLYQIDANTIVGSTSLTAIGVNASNTVFQLSTTNGGVVTLTQYQQVDHPIADDPDATDAPFADHIISLDGGLIELVATGSITDNDGDTDSDTESLDLGGLVQFQDDGPTIDAELAEGASLHIDESLPGVDNAPEETDAVGLGQVTVALVDLIDVTENPVSADQPTTISGGTLVLGPDGGDGLVESGLLTSNGNNPIYLYNVGGVIYGSTALVAPVGVDGSTVFTVAIVGGNVVMTQYQAIEHPTPGASHDENITGLTEGALLLSVTGTDYDGDTDSDTVDLGSIISFGDDGPSVDVIEAALPTDPRLLAALALTTQDDGTEGPGSTSDSSTANFYDLFSLATDGGSDGEASSSLTFDLNLLGGGDGPIDSGLDSHGVTINLYQIDANTIVGSTSLTAIGVNASNTVFQLSTTNGGVVTLTQYQQVDHPIADDPDATDAPFADHIISLDGGLIELVATGSITDNDGDTDSDTESLDLGGLVQFQDDGPTIDAELAEGASLHIDESLPGVDNAPEETDAVGLGQVTVALVDLIDVTENPVSADQPTTISGGTLVLGPDGGDGLVESGLLTSNGNNPIYLYNVGGVIYGSTALVAPVGVDGSTVFTVAIVGGNVVMTQYQAIEHPTPGASHDENITGLTEGALLLSVTGTDYDGDTDSDTVDLGSIISFGDDGPDAALNTGFTKPVLVVDESALSPDGDGDNSDSASFAGAFGAVDYGSDSAGSTSYQLILSGQGAPSGLHALDPADIETTIDPLGRGAQILLYEIGGVIYGSTAANVGAVDVTNTYFTISDDGAGNVTLTRSASLNLWHDTTTDNDDPEILTAALNTIGLQQTVTDSDGDTDTVTVDLSQNVFRFEDDGPTAVSPAAITTGLINGGGNSASANLDGGVGGNNIVSDNFGTDGGRVIFTNASITHLQGLDLKYGGIELTYVISPDGQTLTGFVDADLSGTNNAGDTPVFTIQLQTGIGGNEYTVTMHQPIDSVTEINFNDGTYDFLGGNDPWAAFVDPDINPSQDLLLTPFGDAGQGNAINGNANSAGATGGGGGQNIGTGEGIRLDYVMEITGDPAGAPANYDGNVGQQDHEYVDHYAVNDSSARFGDGQDPTTISIKLFDNVDPGNTGIVYGQGDLVSITSLTINFDGEAQVVNFDIDNLSQTVEVGSLGGFVNRNYTVEWVWDPGDMEYYVEVTGILDIAVRMSVHGENDYEALEIKHLDGDDFAITGFGILTQNTEPVDFTVPITVIDGDGDTVASGELDITATPIPPVVLDLDGDGVEFLGLNAGVQYDYGAGLVATAWAGADDGILVRDANGDGTVTDASEFVFGGNGVTDMEALHAQYGEQLDASDVDFTMFALWTDANSNGVVDAGEMQTLAEAGIVSIGLVSDGASYTAANGDVAVAGSSTYTMADGSTGTAADAAFATSAARTQEVERIAANSNTTVLAAAVAAAGMAASAAAASPADTGEAALSNAVVSVEPMSVAADLTSTTSVQALAASFTGAAATVSVPLGDQMALSSEWHAATGDISHSAGLETTFSALATGTDVIASQMTMPTMATTVAMPPAEAIMALENSPAATIDTVEQILVDALAGGGVNQIDALMNALPDNGNGGIPLIDSAASGLHGLVPSWDMGGDAGFTPAVPTIITAEAMMLHVDAIQPAANG